MCLGGPTVPLRVRLARHRPAADAAAHAHLGLGRIAAVSADARDACAFTSRLVVQPWPLAPLAGLVDDAQLVGDADLLAQGQLAALSHQLEHVARQLGAISVAGSWDLRQTRLWNGATNGDPLEGRDTAPVHEVIAAHARTTPGREALYATGRSLTYAELDARAAALAGLLARAGVRRETLVPFCFEKSVGAVVAVLAILRAGGAFLPLDPADPPARRRALVRDAGARLVVMSEALVAELCAGR